MTEIQQLVAMLRSSGPDLACPPPQARENFAAMMANIPVAEDFRFQAVTLGGVDGLKISSAQSAADAALLYLHGGAFVIGSAHAYRNLAGELGRAGGMDSYAMDYRLAPEHPFPAAVEDGVAAYRALLEQGMQASRIVVGGDSAGGGLSLSVLLRAREQGLPMPAAALLLSPWTDLACEGVSMAGKQAADPALSREWLLDMRDLYLGGADPHQPLASPLHADLKGLPPLLIQVGSAEILLSDATRLAQQAGSHDVATALEIWPDMVHVWQAFGFMLSPGRQAIDRAGEFMRRHTANEK
ncbi:MAG: alpha/beta hydrolase [Pseudomonadales bacterium]|nr:alpha/beta hydrolase [Pseudomonadales bacterium]